MNKSLAYIIKKSSQKKQPKEFKSIRWINGTVVDMLEFIREVYKQKSLEPFNEENADRDGTKILLLQTIVKAQKDGKDYGIPVGAVYSPDADFNTFSVTEGSDDHDLAAMARLFNMVARLSFPFGGGKDIDVSASQFYLEVGDFVIGRSVDDKVYYALPLKCEILDKRDEYGSHNG